MPPTLASHHARVTRDDRAPELLVVAHEVIVERAAAASLERNPSATFGIESACDAAVSIPRSRVAEQDHQTTKGGGMGLLGTTIETPYELYVHKLGAALTMERTILDMLPQLEENANDTQLKESLRLHYEETQQHVANLERAFEALGAGVDESSCPAIEGLEKEGQATLKMVDDTLNDHVIISGVCETEHHEIAVYEGLITKAEAMGEQEVVRLLQRNLDSEEATLEKAKMMGEQLARQTASQPV